MKFTLNRNVLIITLTSISLISGEMSNNLTCYQCIRNNNTECEPQELQSCPPVSDRCVTHISKNAETGFSIKRECGLGPCGFDDEMVNKGLGLNKCDRSREEFFCIICCRESGCNKNKAESYAASGALLLISLVVILYCRNKLVVSW